ncbi:MAG: nitroreductase [Nitratireductor sp.]|nr:nitroreductase [Nitratireductor sp.]
MEVTTAVEKRRSVRAFTSEPVETARLVECLAKAARAPSGGNVQPWKIALLNGAATERFRALMERRLAGEAHPEGEAVEYQVYPPKLIEPYRTARFEVGEEMYGLLGIEREDKAGRRGWFANNYRLFGAPAVAFCFMDRIMLPPQWADCGMFLQTFMLLLEEAGLQSCPQEAWSNYPRTVAEFCGVPDDWMLFCGIAIGHEDTGHPVNALRTRRLPTEDWLKIVE